MIFSTPKPEIKEQASLRSCAYTLGGLDDYSWSADLRRPLTMRVYPATKNSMQGRLLVVSAILMSASASLAPAQDKASASSSSAAKTLKVVQHVEHVEKLAREPMVVELSDGTLFVSGYD